MIGAHLFKKNHRYSKNDWRAEHVLSDGESSLPTFLKPYKEAFGLRDTARPLLFPGTFNGP